MYRFIPFLLLATSACAELDPPTLIKRDRVLGAKVTVDVEPTRAWPLLGESVTVTWVTASPGAAPTFSWILAACPAATSTGLPACAGPLVATSQAAGPVPFLSVPIPADVAAEAMVVTGAICASGTPVLGDSTTMASCDDGSRADVVSQHIFIARDGEENHHPDLAGAPFTLAGADWGGSAAPGCDDALPVVQAGSERTLIGVTFGGSDREAFAVDHDPAPRREELQLASFATAGEVIQQHTYVDADDARESTPVALEWEPPAADEVPAGGLPVTFYFVVRDLRGGVDATTRALCVR
ncbi:MAG: hypothetical protein F9K40_07960 [Kofleriaceae bacterium]|nr:MAG: hypothetical protein F9K40_07960 [Kofleriaceae bacterium]